MKDVYITLGFFALFTFGLCFWTWVGFKTFVVVAGMSTPGIGGAGLLFGALWAFIFVYMFWVVRRVGKDLAAELVKAKAARATTAPDGKDG